VLSKTTISLIFRIGPINSHAFFKGFRSGFLFISIGVGTVTIKKLQPFKSFLLLETENKSEDNALFNSSSLTSFVESIPFLIFSILL